MTLCRYEMNQIRAKAMKPEKAYMKYTLTRDELFAAESDSLE